MLQSKKNKSKPWWIALKVLIAMAALWFIYVRVIEKENASDWWTGAGKSLRDTEHIGWFLLVLLLMFLNWSIEALKWKMIMQKLEGISFFRSLEAVFSGITISFFTPNRIGEYGGRILYVKEGNRIKAVSLTIVGSISQFLVTMILGCLGLLYLRFFSHRQAVLSVLWGDVLIYLSVTITLVAALFYLRIGWLVRTLEKLPALQKVVQHIRVLDEFDNVQLIRIFSLSLGRYMVFVLQYLLLLQVMQVELGWVTGFWLIAVFYLLLAMAPTIGFVELPIRVSACWLLLQHFTTNELGVSASALGIWLINFVVPAIIGSLLIFGIKIVKDQKE